MADGCRRIWKDEGEWCLEAEGIGEHIAASRGWDPLRARLRLRPAKLLNVELGEDLKEGVWVEEGGEAMMLLLDEGVRADDR
jgi:hypothetical protein